MKSITDKNILRINIAQPQPINTVEYVIYNNNNVLYSGKSITTKSFIEIDMQGIIDAAYNHSINDMIDAIRSNYSTILWIPYLDLTYDVTINGTPIGTGLPINVDEPTESYDFTVPYNQNDQLLMCCINTETAGVPVLIDDQDNIVHFYDFGYHQFRSYNPGHMIIVTKISTLVSDFGDMPGSVTFGITDTGGKVVEDKKLWNFEPDCQGNSIILITDKVTYYPITNKKPTYLNNKKYMMNRWLDKIVYQTDVNYSYNIICDAPYEDLNDNYGCFVSIDGKINYGVIDETSIKEEKHKQSFKLKI